MHWCARWGIHFADMSLVAYPSQNPSVRQLSQGEGEEKIVERYIEFIIQAGRRGEKRAVVYSAATVSREWIFPIRLPLYSSPLLSFPASSSPENGITVIRFVSSHIHTYTLITPRTGNAARYFAARALWMQTRIDRNAGLESADVSFIILSR